MSKSDEKICCIAILLFLAGCSSEPATEARPEVTVFAAASLVTALDAIAADYESSHPVDVTISYAASANLAQQIIAGAEADIFISASPEWADEVAKSKPVARREDALENSLVLVVPAANRAKVMSANDLADASVTRIAIGEPASVPAGKYAQEALVKLALWDTVRSKVVNTMDVRQALLYTERGEVDAAIVYQTDAAASAAVKIVEPLDDLLATPVRYSLVRFETDPAGESAADFFDYLFSSEAKSRFDSAGFVRLPLSSGAS